MAILALLGLYSLQFWAIIIKKCIFFQYKMYSPKICIFRISTPMFTVHTEHQVEIGHYKN